MVLDFEGVICESLDEHLLVVWNGAGGHPTVEFSRRGLASLPPSFVERFTRSRPFARHLGHLLIALLEELPPIGSQEAFEAVYQSLDRSRKEAFLHAVSHYRHQVRTSAPEVWLALHRFYRGIIPYLSRYQGPLSIVTARDQASVHQLLESRGLRLSPSQVLGEQSSKLDALATIARREQVEPSSLIFIDDQRSNVRVAGQAGYRAYLATWGDTASLAGEERGAPLIELRLADLLASRFPAPGEPFPPA